MEEHQDNLNIKSKNPPKKGGFFFVFLLPNQFLFPYKSHFFVKNGQYL